MTGVNPFALAAARPSAAAVDAADASPTAVDVPSAGLRQRRPPLSVDTSAPNKIAANDDDGVMEDDHEVEQMRPRVLFLLAMAVTAFAAFAVFVLAELAVHAAPAALLGEARVAAAGTLVLCVPLTSAVAWFPVSVSRGPAGQLRIRSAPTSPSSPLAAPLLARLARRYRSNRMFAVYQTAGWSLYALFLALLLACAVAPGALPLCRAGHRSNLAVTALIAEVLILSSALTLEKRRDRNLEKRRDRFAVQLNNFNNMLLLVGALGLAVGSEYERHASGSTSGVYPLSAGVGSLLLFVTALLNTYGLGGVLSTKDGWRFYQPFTGGARFVLFQIVSWSCFGAGLLIQGLYLISLVVVELELFVGAMLVAGALFITSEVVMMMSLLVFRKTAQRVDSQEQQVADATEPTLRSRFQERVSAFADECFGVLVAAGLANVHYLPNVCLLVFYTATTRLGPFDVLVYTLLTTLYEFLMVISRSIAIHMYNKDSQYGQLKEINEYQVKYVLPRLVTGVMPAIISYYHWIHDLEALYPVVALTVFIYVYEVTYRGNPQHSGSRMRPSWVTEGSMFLDAAQRYFSGKVIRSTPLDPSEQYIMAFHPHGIMALSVMWLQFTDQWRKLFPGVYAHILTASVLHQIPYARDVLQSFGGREVTRQAFVATLHEKESVMIVPGGQAEMLQQQSARKQVRVYTHHKGFVRIAVENGVSLLPILSYKEGEMLDNVRAPALQQWAVKKLGFPFPYFPYGRAMLPIPRRTEIAIVVGAPLRVKQIANPTAEDIDKVHAEYFQRLKELFYNYRDEAGCSDYELVLI